MIRIIIIVIGVIKINSINHKVMNEGINTRYKWKHHYKIEKQKTMIKIQKGMLEGRNHHLRREVSRKGQLTLEKIFKDLYSIRRWNKHDVYELW